MFEPKAQAKGTAARLLSFPHRWYWRKPRILNDVLLLVPRNRAVGVAGAGFHSACEGG